MPAVKSSRGLEVHDPLHRSLLRVASLAVAAMALGMPLACYAGRNQVAAGWGDATNITNEIFEKTDPHCMGYVGRYTSLVKDVDRKVEFRGQLTITWKGDKCVFETNSIPNHDFNDKSLPFVNEIKAVKESYEIPVEPKVADTPTGLEVLWDNAIFLNGVKLDLLAAACYGVGLETQKLGEEKIGCFEMDWAWRYDPLHPKNNFQADTHNAHGQPDGAYHYHGNPNAMFKEPGSDKIAPLDKASPVIGFAADGFPIYGPYIEEEGKIRRVRSSYALRVGPRQHQKNQAYFPGGTYDGTFRDDYEYIEGRGDLDRCNGMLRNGQYGYYVTYTYPWVMGCFKGTPDPSFRKEFEQGEAPHRH